MNYRLTEIYDINELKELCESFTQLTVTAILDLEGKVHVATGWQPICTKFHRVNNETKKHCTESDTLLAGKLKAGGKYHIYKCKNGLIDVAMPIYVGNIHVGNFFTGQFLTDKPNVKYFRKQAKKYGFDEQKYLTALTSVPIFSEEQINKTIQFLVKLIETIGNIGIKNLKSIENAKQLEIDKNNIKDANEEYATLNEEYKAQNEELLNAKEKADQSKIDLLKKNKEYESLNEELRQTNEELFIAKKQAEENEKQFKQLFENMEQGFAVHKMIYDKYNKPIDYRFIHINKAFEKQTGITATHFIGKTVKELLPETEQIWIENYGKVAQTGIPFHFENYSNELKKHYDVVAYSPKKDFFAVIFSDVTQNKEVQNELIKAKEKAEESELYFRTLIEKSPMPMVITDENQNIELFNEKFTELFGYTLQDVSTAEKWWELAYPNIEYRTKVQNSWMIAIEKALKNNTDIEMQVWDFVIKNRTKKTCEFFMVPLGQKNLIVMNDITDKRKNEKELIIAKEKAEESDQLKTEFINNMSHEIRTPMNGILGFSSFLNKENLTNEKRKHYVNIIQNSGNQLMRIIDDILEISKLGTKQVKTVETEICLNDLLLELFSIFDIKAKENKIPLYLKKGLSDKDSLIFTDETKLNKILSNLLENALKFTREGFIEFGYQQLNNELEIYVKDTGIGVKSESQKTIFERFSQEEKGLSQNVGGLGLGLSIAKENAELLGGKIVLKSEKGKGATFFVTIPYKPVNEKNSNSVNDKNEMLEEHKKWTILIVEDEEVNYLYIETLLEDEIDIDCNILHAKNGQEAVEICKTNSEIDFVLMDLKMPIMNGYEATKQIREFRPDLSIVAKTAYSTSEDKEKAISAGCNDFISKPIKEETLNLIMNKYLIRK